MDRYLVNMLAGMAFDSAFAEISPQGTIKGEIEVESVAVLHAASKENRRGYKDIYEFIVHALEEGVGREGFNFFDRFILRNQKYESSHNNYRILRRDDPAALDEALQAKYVQEMERMQTQLLQVLKSKNND